MKYSGLGYCIYGVARRLLEMKKKIDEKKKNIWVLQCVKQEKKFKINIIGSTGK